MAEWPALIAGHTNILSVLSLKGLKWIIFAVFQYVSIPLI